MGHIIDGVRYEHFPPFEDLPEETRDFIVKGLVQLYSLDGRRYGERIGDGLPLGSCRPGTGHGGRVLVRPGEEG